MLLLASITDPLVQLATDIIDALGLPGIFLLMTAESACLPIPSEGTMLFAGFGVSRGDFSLFEVVLVGVAGNLIGSWIAYAIGYFGRVDVLERHGRKLHITPAKLELAHRWCERRGPIVIAVGRLLPFVRTYISYPAGVARMDIRRFTAATLAGGAVLSVTWALVGQAVGSSWTKWKHALGYVDVAVVVLVLLAAGWVLVRWYRGRGRPADVPA
jgi:membrane protein DedA with SNARE-associated domain